MNVVDSSGWLEYLGDGPGASFFAEPLADPAALVVPAISICEVFKRLLQLRDESTALAVAALMMQGTVVELDGPLALEAAKLGFDLRLPLADSIILATARRHDAVLWTQDDDFAGIEGVRYRPKKATARPGRGK